VREGSYVYQDKKRLRCGYTTGSCAAAAAKAAVRMLLLGEVCERVDLVTPGGVSLSLLPEHLVRSGESVSCGVRKDGGDDPDVTDGILVMVNVAKEAGPGVRITGGAGVGRVTRPGLEQPPGSYAINETPRRMIREVAREAMEEAGYKGGLCITVSVPEGERLCARTFNPSLGIEGGISILGTSGIVEPMSEKALTDTILLELKMHAARGERCCIITPGNYGMHFIAQTLHLDLSQTVKCGNFIGDTLDMAPVCQLNGVLLVGHLGKLVKLGAGMLNTHSRYGDGRMEVLCSCALRAGADIPLLKGILECVTTDGALSLLAGAGLLEQTMDILLEKIAFHLKRRAFEGVQVEAIVFSNAYGLLGQTSGARELMDRIHREMEAF